MSVDLTAIVVAFVGGLFSILGAYATYLIDTHVSNTAAKVTLGNAVRNSLGMMQQVAVGAIAARHPDVTLPTVTPPLAAAVQYVLDQAGPEVKRFPEISQQDIADKITAQRGLATPPAPAIIAPLQTGPPPALTPRAS